MKNQISKLLLAQILLFSTYSAYSQRYENFVFSKDIAISLSESQKMLDETVLKYKHSEEYTVTEDAELQYTFVHSIKRVNSDKAIERNNKIYLNIGEGSNYLYQKARVITPSGKIITLKEEDIKVGVYEGDNGEERKYYYYALEGLEKGSIIERATYKVNNSYYYGSLVYLQSDIITYNQEFELICPPHLEFELKSLNNAPEVLIDTTEKEVNRWAVHLDSVDKILEQPYVYVNTVKKGVLFKLDRNNAMNKGDITTYSNVNENVYSSIFPELSKKAQKRITSIAKKINLSKAKNATEKVQLIENHLKNEFQITNQSSAELRDVETICENKAMDNVGSCIMHAALLKEAGIDDIEIVLTTDRSELLFNPDFEAYLYLRNYLFYIPEIETYIAPTELLSRGKYIPSTWAHNYGLHIKSMDLGSMKAYVGEVRFIEALPYTANTDTMIINVDFSKNSSSPQINIEKRMMGYSSQYIQPLIHLLDEPSKEELKNSLKSMVHEEIENEEIEMSNVEKDDFGKAPFILNIKTEDHPFVSQAGNDLLFNIGELIGEQMELYQEHNRQFDIVADHERLYLRTIRFNVPEGYSIKNLEELNMSFKYGGEEEVYDLYFVSKVEKEEDEFVLNCKEYYSTIEYPAEKFDEFKKVINAAADFNKLVLVMTKD